MNNTILVIDDNHRVFESLEPNLNHFGIKALYARNKTTAKQKLLTNSIDTVLLDIMLKNENGITILKLIKEIAPKIPVIMITGYASIDTAVESMKNGAFDYVKKPLNFDRLFKVIENAIELHKLSSENAVLKRRLKELTPKVYVKNQVMRLAIEQAKKLAKTDIPILIVGENGSGKEIIADLIHANSNRVTSKMIKANCAAFPDTLLDNELFGHERGAYTGADSLFQGVFERADGSTLFLDEIGDMPLTIQAKILRVLQNKEIRRIGGQETLTVNVRFVAATNKNLMNLMEEKKFRQDLFYRLNAAIITVPPLRERREDIELLVQYFLKEFSAASSKHIDSVCPEVMQLFNRYKWPGNVRELKNTINYGVAIASGSSIGVDDLPPSLRQLIHEDSSSLNIREANEKKLIERTLRECGFNKKRTAEILNMSRKTLYTRIANYEIST